MSGTLQEGTGQLVASAQEGQQQGLPAEQQQQERPQQRAGEEGPEVDYISPAQVCGWLQVERGPAHTKELACQAAAQRCQRPTHCLPASHFDLQYYHTRDVAARLKHQEELRHRSGPEAPHSHRAAAEAARLRELGPAEEEGRVRGMPAAHRHAGTLCCRCLLGIHGMSCIFAG
jgi:hypothetical protein